MAPLKNDPQTNLQIKPWPEKLSFIVSDRKNVQTRWRDFEAGSSCCLWSSSSWSCLWSWIAYSFWASMVHQVQPEQTTITKLKDELADQIFQLSDISTRTAFEGKAKRALWFIFWDSCCLLLDLMAESRRQRTAGLNPTRTAAFTFCGKRWSAHTMINLALKLVWVEKVLNKTFYNVIA